MPKKRKSTRARRPQSRPQPRTKADHDLTTYTQVPTPRRPAGPTGGTSRLVEAARAQQLVSPARAPVRQDPRPATADPAASVHGGRSGDAPAHHGLAPTYWLEGSDEAVPVAVHFFGTAVDGACRGQWFERRARIPELPSGVGRTSVTSPVRDLPTGTWHVQAQGVDERGQPVGAPQHENVTTRLWPFVRGPGVRPFAWPALVLLGVVLAVVVQVLLVQAEGLDARSAALSAVVAAVVGFLSAKAGYMVLHRVPPSEFATAGTLIQVFLVGAFSALIGSAWLADLPVLRLLDLTTSGVFAAMALARPGCWLGGCCAGRPTASRWGLWSSDRRVGVRRVPVQLLESALAGTIALGSLLFVLTVEQRPDGVVLALSASVYTLGRQLLFPLRAQARRTSRGRLVTTAAASVATIVSLALLLVR